MMYKRYARENTIFVFSRALNDYVMTAIFNSTNAESGLRTTVIWAECGIGTLTFLFTLCNFVLRVIIYRDSYVADRD